MFEPCDDDLVILLDIALAPTLGDKIDAFGRATDEDDLTRRGSIHKAARFFACALIGIGSSRR